MRIVPLAGETLPLFVPLPTVCPLDALGIRENLENPAVQGSLRRAWKKVPWSCFRPCPPAYSSFSPMGALGFFGFCFCRWWVPFPLPPPLAGAAHLGGPHAAFGPEGGGA